MTESYIHQFAAQAKLASISREFSGECFDFDQRRLFLVYSKEKNVLAVLATRFGKNLIYQRFLLFKQTIPLGN